ALAIVGPVVVLVSDSLSVVVGIAAAVALAWLGTRWIYAPVIVGAGEASGDAAYVRSESYVDPVFWPTLGSFVAIGLAIALPLGVVMTLVAAVVSILLPNIFTYALMTGVAVVLGAATVGASGLESAWNQAEGGGSEPVDTQTGHTGGPTAVAPVTPAPALELD
ncbi:MAG: hypothetical protein JWN72_2730, partial [Thermoleophilia bacterium]|nr:hypothetical protein [Thermoleophilia bacterium]